MIRRSWRYRAISMSCTAIPFVVAWWSMCTFVTAMFALRTNANDLSMDFFIKYPHDGETVLLPINFAAMIKVSNLELFEAQYGRMWMCIEIDGAVVTCSGVIHPTFVVNNINVGSHTVQMFITEANAALSNTTTTNVIRHFETPEITFTALNESEYEAYLDIVEEEQKQLGMNNAQDILEWFEEQKQQQQFVMSENPIKSIQTVNRPLHSTDTESIMMVIGVKTDVIKNFPLRQAIRETWASKSALPLGVMVIFIGCRPKLFHDIDGVLGAAIEWEKRVYGDLLTDELDCDDYYQTLTRKVTEFLVFTVQNFQEAAYVMIADDDIYVKLPEFLAAIRALGPARRIYAGEPWNKRGELPSNFHRDPSKIHYLSLKTYPIRQAPMMLYGAHFVLSMDCVQFIAKNQLRLSDLGGMDDISISFWLMALMQAHAQEIHSLRILRSLPCSNNLILLADLSPLAIRMIHDNLANNRKFCHGCERSTWLKRTQRLPSPYRKLASLQFSTNFEAIKNNATTLKITSIISTPFNAGAKFAYEPAAESIHQYAKRIYPLIVQISKGTAPAFHPFYTQLQQHLQETYMNITHIASVQMNQSQLELWEDNFRHEHN